MCRFLELSLYYVNKVQLPSKAYAFQMISGIV